MGSNARRQVRLRVQNQPKPRDQVPEGHLPPEPVPHWPGRHVDLPAGQVYVRSAPAIAGAEPAIFIHGLGGSSTNWTDLMDLLSRPVEGQPAAPVLACAALDLPGFGSSPPACGGYSVNAHVATVIQLIEEQGLGPVHLFGNSLGGTVSIRVAAARPEDRKSTRLNSSHTVISYAVFCLKKKTLNRYDRRDIRGDDDHRRPPALGERARPRLRPSLPGHPSLGSEGDATRRGEAPSALGCD